MLRLGSGSSRVAGTRRRKPTLFPYSRPTTAARHCFPIWLLYYVRRFSSEKNTGRIVSLKKVQVNARCQHKLGNPPREVQQRPEKGYVSATVGLVPNSASLCDLGTRSLAGILKDLGGTRKEPDSVGAWLDCGGGGVVLGLPVGLRFRACCWSTDVPKGLVVPIEGLATAEDASPSACRALFEFCRPPLGAEEMRPSPLLSRTKT